MFSSSLFGMFILDRDLIGYGNLPGLVQAWLEDTGGFAAVGLAVYILYAMLAGIGTISFGQGTQQGDPAGWSPWGCSHYCVTSSFSSCW